MSEKISPIGFSFNTNRYSNSDLVQKAKPQHKPTVVVNSEIFDYGDVFERRHFEPERLYSWEGNGKVKGLFEAKTRDNFVSLTKTKEGGIFEKVKKGASELFARYTKEGRLVELAEVTPDKTVFINRVGKLSEETGMAAKVKLQNLIRGIKVI